MSSDHGSLSCRHHGPVAVVEEEVVCSSALALEGIDEAVVLRDWYKDIPRLGKSAAFKKHMDLSLDDFYSRFDAFIRQPDEDIMKIFGP